MTVHWTCPSPNNILTPFWSVHHPPVHQRPIITSPNTLQLLTAQSTCSTNPSFLIWFHPRQCRPRPDLCSILHSDSILVWVILDSSKTCQEVTSRSFLILTSWSQQLEDSPFLAILIITNLQLFQVFIKTSPQHPCPSSLPVQNQRRMKTPRVTEPRSFVSQRESGMETHISKDQWMLSWSGPRMSGRRFSRPALTCTTQTFLKSWVSYDI